MPDDRKFSKQELAAQVGGNAQECHAIPSPFGVVMKCRLPCARCAKLTKEYADGARERERARLEYETNEKKQTSRPRSITP